MRARAKYGIVGIVALIAISTAISYWALLSDRSERASLYVIIPGSASGLTTDSWVLFNGINIGYVENISIDVNDPRKVVVETLVSRDAPITTSTVASIIVAPTGEASIEMRNLRRGDPLLFPLAEESGKWPVLYADPTEVANPPPTRRTIWIWISERTGTQLAVQIASFGALIWIAAMVVLYWSRPSWVIALHERMPEPEKIEATASLFEKASFGAAGIVCWIISALLMFMASRPRALDAWVNDRLSDARPLFEQRPSVGDRQIALDLPIRIGTIRHNKPWPEITRLVSTSSPMAVLISGPGGAGKTTLAFEFGRRALNATGAKRLGRHAMLPLLIESDVPEQAATSDGLTPYLAGMLRTAVNEKRRITVRLTSALLRTGRILVVVDGMSERSSHTRDAFNPQRQGFEILRLVVTSRERMMAGMNTLIETESIPSGALFDFMSSYLQEMEAEGEGKKPDEDRIFEACAELKRLLGETPCTPLLAILWAKEIGAPLRVDRPRGVASLMDSYVRRLLLPAAISDEAQIGQLTKDAAKIAELELGESYQPGYVTRSAALEVLRKLDSKEPEKRFAILERSRLLESPPESDIVRISPDPVAEHLAARLTIEDLGSDEKGWRSVLDTLTKQHLPEGFVVALAACYEDDVHGRRIPPLIGNQIKSLRIKVGQPQWSAPISPDRSAIELML
ncbi:MlaD family protein [Rhizobium ruizarguesonis]